MFSISKAQLDQLKALIATIESQPCLQAEQEPAPIDPQTLVVPVDQHEELVRGIPKRKQWNVCEQGVVQKFLDILQTHFFANQEQTNEFLSLFNHHKMVISGGTVLAAYQAHKNNEDVACLDLGDLDIFYSNDDYYSSSHYTHSLIKTLEGLGYKQIDDSHSYNTTPLLHKRAKLDPIERRKDYTSMKTVKHVQNFVNANDKVIQLIQVDYFAVRSHIRQFDLSCCQMYYMKGNIYQRSLYAELTAHNFMVLCWGDKDLMKDQKYVDRIRKYIQRGWKPVTEFSLHMHQAPQDIKEQLQLISTKPSIINITVVQPEQLLETVTQEIQKAQEFKTFSSTYQAIHTWIAAIKHWRFDTQIANKYKQQLRTQLDVLISLANDQQNLQSIVQSMFEIQDRRWIILKLIDHSDKFKTLFNSELIKQAVNHNFARDHIFFLKTVCSQS